MKKAIKNAIFTLLFLTLSTSTVLLVYLHFFASDDKDLSGEWSANLDMNKQAAVTALSWLQDIEAVSISLEDMESYMQDLTIQVDLTLEQTANAEGTFRCNVSPESYDACNQAAYEAFAEAFLELLARRLCMAGYTGSTDREAMEELVNETFGMSTVSYLMSYGPALLPSLEDMQAGYDGSGTYRAAEGILTRHFDAGGPFDTGEAVTTKEECYIRNDSNLVLFEKMDAAAYDALSDYDPVIYTLKQPSN